MALVTLCPGCGTSFRVNAAQLQACDGDVRCGHCQRVFDGFATLLTVPESDLTYLPPPADDRLQSESQSESLSTDAAIPLSESSSYDSTELSIRPDWNPEAIETSDSLLLDDAKPANASLRWWGLANAWLLLLLLGQIAYIYRTELTVYAPGTRSYLEQFCAQFSCTIPYPQAIKQWGIESSDLRKNSARQPEVTTLTAIIRNHASFVQQLPALQLSLLDVHDQLVASRIFTAQEYLREEDQKLQFIEPQQEIDIRLDFDSSRLNVLGYRLLLLYP